MGVAWKGDWMVADGGVGHWFFHHRGAEGTEDLLTTGRVDTDRQDTNGTNERVYGLQALAQEMQ